MSKGLKRFKKEMGVVLLSSMMLSNIPIIEVKANELNESKKETKYTTSTSNYDKQAKIINIPDKNLKAAINSKLRKEVDSDITKSELESIKSLEITSKSIKDLEGLQYCINLSNLNVDDNKISDLSPLEGLTKLEDLHLGGNGITDISSLEKLTQLESLYLADNEINKRSQLSSLFGLTKLMILDLSCNNISDITPLLDIKFPSSDYVIYLSGNPLNLKDAKNKVAIEIMGDRLIYDKEAPLLIAEDKIIKVGDIFDPLKDIEATDKDGKDITSKITVIGTVDNKNPGIYELTYSVRDNGYTIIKKIKVTVQNKIQISFSDIKNHWSEDAIKLFVEEGFINGYKDNTFKPNNSMTRAEFVKLVNKVFGYTQKQPENFNDVNEKDWFYEDVCIGVKVGYISGKSKDKFAPNDNITRQEVASILTNIMKNKDINLDKLNTFKDIDKIDKWAQSSVEGAIEAGYLSGYEDNTVRAKGNITRAEAVSMLSRVKK